MRPRTIAKPSTICLRCKQTKSSGGPCWNPDCAESPFEKGLAGISKSLAALEETKNRLRLKVSKAIRYSSETHAPEVRRNTGTSEITGRLFEIDVKIISLNHDLQDLLKTIEL